MKPSTKQEKLRFAQNAYQDLLAIKQRHLGEFEEESLDLIQEYKDLVNRLKRSLPKEFLQLHLSEYLSLGDNINEVMTNWEKREEEKFQEGLRKELRTKVGQNRGVRFDNSVRLSPKTPRTPKLKLPKRNALTTRNRAIKMHLDVEITPNGTLIYRRKTGQVVTLDRKSMIDADFDEQPSPLTASSTSTIKKVRKRNYCKTPATAGPVTRSRKTNK